MDEDEAASLISPICLEPVRPQELPMNPRVQENPERMLFVKKKSQLKVCGPYQG